MYTVKVLVKSYINNARHYPGDIIPVETLDGRVELIEKGPPEKAPAKAPAKAAGKAKAPKDALGDALGGKPATFSEITEQANAEFD